MKPKLKSPAVLRIETPCGGIYAEPKSGGWNASAPGGKRIALGSMRIAEAVEELKEIADDCYGGAGEVTQLANAGWVPFAPGINGRKDAAERRKLIQARKASA